MTTTRNDPATTTDMATGPVPVRLDFDERSPGFARAMSHLDHAATRELDRVELDTRLRELVRVRASAAQRLRVLRGHAHHRRQRRR